jgi:hypothetical protein
MMNLIIYALFYFIFYFCRFIYAPLTTPLAERSPFEMAFGSKHRSPRS